MPVQLPIIQNENPSTIFHKEVAFSTQDEISGQNIIEGYNVNGPTNSTITVIPLAGGTKFVVPLTSDSTSPGAPFLKFHFPNGTSGNKLYVTFAVKNARMADGYYDYKTGIPSGYRTQLRSFIVSPINTVQFNNLSGPQIKEIRFTTYGSSTNKPAEAVTFKVTFKALYSPLTTDVASDQPLTLTDLATGPASGTGGTTIGTGGIQLTGFPGLTANFTPRGGG
jgi:hypothetical protein